MHMCGFTSPGRWDRFLEPDESAGGQGLCQNPQPFLNPMAVPSGSDVKEIAGSPFGFR